MRLRGGVLCGVTWSSTIFGWRFGASFSLQRGKGREGFLRRLASKVLLAVVGWVGLESFFEFLQGSLAHASRDVESVKDVLELTAVALGSVVLRVNRCPSRGPVDVESIDDVEDFPVVPYLARV